MLMKHNIKLYILMAATPGQSVNKTKYESQFSVTHNIINN